MIHVGGDAQMDDMGYDSKSLAVEPKPTHVVRKDVLYPQIHWLSIILPFKWPISVGYTHSQTNPNQCLGSIWIVFETISGFKWTCLKMVYTP